MLCNTPQLQVVRENKLGITGMVFWQAGTWEDITVSQPMIVMVRQQGEKFEISASDPTQKLEEAVITIGRNLTPQSLDEKISVSGEEETILTIDTKGGYGPQFRRFFPGNNPRKELQRGDIEKEAVNVEYRRTLMLLIFILVCSTTRMATASLPPNIIFHSEDKVSWFAPKNSVVSKDETVKYKDAAMSVKWELTQGTVGELRLQQLATRGMTTDWTQYDTLKLRLYCPQANGNHILIRPTLTQDGYSEKQEDGSTIPRYYEQSFDMDWTG